MSKSVFWARAILGGLLLLALVFVVRHEAQFGELLTHMRQGRSQWVFAAVMFQGGTLVNQPALYQSLYVALGLPVRWRDLAVLVWAGHCANVVTPSAGLGGTALLMADARRRGYDLGKVAAANLLYFVLNFLWYACLLLLSLALLLVRHQMKPSEGISALVLLGLIAVALVLLFFFATKPQLLAAKARSVFEGVNRIWRRFFGAPCPGAAAWEAGIAFGTDMADALKTARGHMARPWFHAILVDSLEIIVLGCCFAAFTGERGVAVGPVIVLVGYSLGTLFNIISITPQGLGVVEGVMTAVFVSLGVPLERAALVVLVYRGLSFWLPFFVGCFALRWAVLPRDRESAIS